MRRTATLASVVMLGIGLHVPAWAEHAWVLWADVDQVGGRFLAVSKSWSVVGSMQNREACERAQAANVTENAKPQKAEARSRVTKHVDRNVVTMRTEELDADGQWRPGGVSRVRFVCLPNTIDPREAKAK